MGNVEGGSGFALVLIRYPLIRPGHRLTVPRYYSEHRSPFKSFSRGKQLPRCTKKSALRGFFLVHGEGFEPS